jgi:quercetin dioxygenase-like cupin family protein
LSIAKTISVVAAETLLCAGTVSATPGSGVSSNTLAEGASPDGIAVDNRGTTAVSVREITIAPGGSTGWHYHDGQLLAVVKSGTLTRTLHDCSTEVTSAGASFVEPAGQDRPHIGENRGATPVVLLVTYVLPAGQPPSRDAPKPAACAP